MVRAPSQPLHPAVYIKRVVKESKAHISPDECIPPEDGRRGRWEAFERCEGVGGSVAGYIHADDAACHGYEASHQDLLMDAPRVGDRFAFFQEGGELCIGGGGGGGSCGGEDVGDDEAVGSQWSFR